MVDCPLCFVAADFHMPVAICHILVHSSGNDNPRDRCVIFQGFNSEFNSILIRMMRDLDFQYWAIFLCPRIHPIGTESSSFRGNVSSRHAPAFPNPSSMSWIVTKHCPGEIFLLKPVVSLAYSRR